MVTYLNYSSSENVTGFASGFDYASNITNTAIGSPDAFSVMLLGMFFIGFYVISAKYTQDRALIYSTFMLNIVAFLMVSAGILNPSIQLLCIIGLVGAVFWGSRLG